MEYQNRHDDMQILGEETNYDYCVKRRLNSLAEPVAFAKYLIPLGHTGSTKLAFNVHYGTITGMGGSIGLGFFM